MQIYSVTVSNLRGINEIELQTNPLTALIGSNNSCKSTLLKAIELFFDAAPKLSSEDFNASNPDDRIEITVEFNQLTPSEIELFSSAVIDGTLQVSRSLSLTDDDSGQYAVTAEVNPAFSEIRAETNGTTRRRLYTALMAEYQELEAIRTHTEIEQKLLDWERAHPNALERQRIRGFFGATNVANGKLKKKTNVHLVPAVQDVADETADIKKVHCFRFCRQLPVKY